MERGVDVGEMWYDGSVNVGDGLLLSCFGVFCICWYTGKIQMKKNCCALIFAFVLMEV